MPFWISQEIEYAPRGLSGASTANPAEQRTLTPSPSPTSLEDSLAGEGSKKATSSPPSPASESSSEVGEGLGVRALQYPKPCLAREFQSATTEFDSARRLVLRLGYEDFGI